MTRKYKSKLEEAAGNVLGDEWEYEPTRLPYTIIRHYIPDFVKGDTIIEIKGYFRPGDSLKYKSVAEQMKKDGKRFIMVFQNLHARVRKDRRTTYKEWGEKNGVECIGIFELEDYDYE